MNKQIELEVTLVVCPRCERNLFTPYNIELHPVAGRLMKERKLPMYPALSRADNQTYVCSDCGMDEAMRDFAHMPPMSPDDWPIPEEERL
jgi:hypothetical protein